MGTPAQTVKLAIRHAMAGAFFHSQIHRMRGRGKAVILTYHRVLPEAALHQYPVQAGMYVLNDVFERHIQYLREEFEIVSLSELLCLWRERRWDHRKQYCVITFDDGWLDNYEYAFPILKKYDVPATIFLPTDYIGTKKWFWPEQLSYLLNRLWDPGVDAAKQEKAWNRLTESFDSQDSGCQHPRLVPSRTRQELTDVIVERCKDLSPEQIETLIAALSALLEVSIPDERLVMGWNEVAEMSQCRISFGSHSCSHRLLTNIPLSEAKAELAESLRVLKQNAVRLVPVFCYPNGNTNDAIQSLVREYGYQAAVGVEKGTEGPDPVNLYQLRRISVHNDITASIPLFAFHLFGPLN